MRKGQFLAISLALVLILAAVAPVGATAKPVLQTTPGSTIEVEGYVMPIFTSYGRDGQPGVWLMNSATGEESLWLPAEVIPAREHEASDRRPSWPSHPAELVVMPTEDPETYWVWDVFRFVSAVGGSSRWLPRWRLVSRAAVLGN